MRNPKWLEKKQNQTPKEKSLKQEKSAAKRFKGKTTPASGAFKGMKADVLFRKVRLECKRTDKPTMTFDKAWLDKLKRETAVDENYALEMEFLDERLYVIPEGLFRFLEWNLTTPKEEIITALQEGSYGDLQSYKKR